MERCSAVVSLIVRGMLRVNESSPDALHAAQGNSSRLTQLVTKSLAPTERIGVMAQVRRALFGEGHLERREARIMQRVAQVLGLET